MEEQIKEAHENLKQSCEKLGEAIQGFTESINNFYQKANRESPEDLKSLYEDENNLESLFIEKDYFEELELYNLCAAIHNRITELL